MLCLVTQSCLTLCDPMNCSPPGSSLHGILQARILEWVSVSSSRGDCMLELILFAMPTGEGNGTPLQYSCLEIPMDGGAW